MQHGEGRFFEDVERVEELAQVGQGELERQSLDDVVIHAEVLALGAASNADVMAAAVEILLKVSLPYFRDFVRSGSTSYFSASPVA